MTESLINAVISISPEARRGELKISVAKSLCTDRSLLRRDDKQWEICYLEIQMFRLRSTWQRIL